MAKMLIAGNWKMNLNREDSQSLAAGLAAEVPAGGAVGVAVCPPFVYLDVVREAIAGSGVALGAQDMYFEESGAFTGEVSAAMLQDLACTYVILGHSERRHVLGETDELINKKVHAAFAAGLTPIVCVGELLEEREAGKTGEVIKSQFEGSLAGLTADQMRQTVIAYEPVWAIGTGKVATTEQAEEVHADLRKLIATGYDEAVAADVTIQYGGSVKPDNAVGLLSQPNINGALVGGASLKVESFLGIVQAAPQ